MGMFGPYSDGAVAGPGTGPTSPAIFTPSPGAPAPVTPVSPGTGPDEALAQTFVQATPSGSWTIVHNFSRTPSIAVYDNTGREVYPDITLVNKFTIRVDFSSVMDGTAILT